MPELTKEALDDAYKKGMLRAARIAETHFLDVNGSEQDKYLSGKEIATVIRLEVEWECKNNEH